MCATVLATSESSTFAERYAVGVFSSHCQCEPMIPLVTESGAVWEVALTVRLRWHHRESCWRSSPWSSRSRHLSRRGVPRKVQSHGWSQHTQVSKHGSDFVCAASAIAVAKLLHSSLNAVAMLK